MFELYNFNEAEILAFILVLLRVASCFATWPIFGSDQVPTYVKILWSIAFTLMIFPIIGWKKLGLDYDSALVPWLAVREVSLGILLGLISRLFFFAISVCGDFVSTAMGMSSDSIFNPALGGRVTSMENFYLWLGTVVFFGVNGHHYLISGLVQSFELVPLSAKGLSFQSFQDLSTLGQSVMTIGLQMSAPIFASLLVMNVAMAVVSRTAPQMNVLVMSLSANMLMGLVVLIVALPMTVDNMTEVVKEMTERVFRVLTRV